MLLYLATEAEDGPNPVIPATGEIIVGLIAFAVLCYVLMKYAFPKMEQTFQARRDAIEGGIERAEQAQAEAQRTLTEYKRQLAEARTEAAQIRDNARAEGQRIIEELRTEAQAEAARIVQRGEEQLSAQRQQVVRELRGEIGTLAVRLSERVVGETLAEDARRSGTVDRFLDELEGMSAPATVGAPASTATATAEPTPAPPVAPTSPQSAPAEPGPAAGSTDGDGTDGGDTPPSSGSTRRPRRKS